MQLKRDLYLSSLDNPVKPQTLNTGLAGGKINHPEQQSYTINREDAAVSERAGTSQL